VEPLPSRPPELTKPEHLINRELSWIAFNQRVLAEGLDPRTPLLERLKFLAIFSSNLDEFFMVRVAGIKRRIAQNMATLTPDGLSPQVELLAVQQALKPLVQKQHDFFGAVLRPELSRQGVDIKNYADLTNGQREYLHAYFREKIFPTLTPLAIEPSHFPHVSNLSLSMIAVVREPQASGRHLARVKVPLLQTRFIPLAEPMTFVPVEQVLAHNLELLFPGMMVSPDECYEFRITRDAELDIEEEEADDLISALQQELRKQRFGPVVRLELSDRTPPDIRAELMARLEIAETDTYDIPHLLGLGSLMALTGLPLPEHRLPDWRSVTHPRIKAAEESGTIFQVIRAGDFLVHHPYQSFTTTVQRFIEEAADDPDVLAIKQTLYRTSGDSPIVHALIRAAENNKQVAVLVELKARFDEANNILWARKLENAGVHVIYGKRGLKTHTKTALVIRREGEHLMRYYHIGTGNYNSRTARFYSDLGLFSCREDIGNDLLNLFNYLTGISRHRDYQQLLVAPVNMRDRFLQMIAREVHHQRQGYHSYIIAKMNSLVDPEIITALYEASEAGVNIDLIVRGICCLRAGVPGLSDRIRVISVIGRFLEHSRIFYFSNGGKEVVYIGSADWMPRNLDMRVEVITPVHEPALVRELKELLDVVLADNRQAWELLPDNTYRQRHPQEGEPEMSSQRHFMSVGRPEFA